MIACLTEENRILWEKLGHKRILLNDAQKRRLATAAMKPGREAVGRFGLMRRCPVCDHMLIGKGKYCGDCGSKV